MVCGINMECVQRRLLAEKELTFARALTMAQAMEKAVSDTKDLQQAQSTNIPSSEGKVNTLGHYNKDSEIHVEWCSGQSFKTGMLSLWW